MSELMLGVSDEGVVERLRDRKSYEYPDLLCQKAADLIDRLTRERDELGARNDELMRLASVDSAIYWKGRHEITERERDEARADLAEAIEAGARLLVAQAQKAVAYMNERDEARRALDDIARRFPEVGHALNRDALRAISTGEG